MKSFVRMSALVTSLVLSLAGYSLGQAVDPAVQVRYDAALGHFLTGSNGMTLYVFSNDAPGTSTCYEQCAANWPPVLIEAERPVVAPPVDTWRVRHRRA